jgi:hypothetical protein
MIHFLLCDFTSTLRKCLQKPQRPLSGSLLLANMLIITGLFFSSCDNDRQLSVPDVSHIDTGMDLVRFDSIMHHMDTTDIRNSLVALRNTYPDFTRIYFKRILHIAPESLADKQPLEQKIQQLISSREWKALNDTVVHIYPDLEDLRQELDQVFKFYKFYFPERQVPQVYTCLSEFGTANFLFAQQDGRDGLGISLDMFLGEQFDYTVLSSFSGTFSAFNARTLNRAHLVKKTTDVIIDDLIEPASQFRMLDVLVYEGKKQYLRELLLPYQSDTIRWEYTQEQMQWVKDNEWNIYTYLISNDLLYSTEVNKYLRLINPAPHSIDMPPEAPGRAVNYIGYLIVKSYIERNPNIPLAELLRTDDGQLFLEKGKYKPKR